MAYYNVDDIERDAVGFNMAEYSRDRDCDQAANLYNDRPRSRQPNRGGYRGVSRPASRQRPPSSQRDPTDTPTDGARVNLWQLFNVILRDYGGKARLGEVRRLFPADMSIPEIKDWLTESSAKHRFLLFTDVRNERIQFISVCIPLRLCIRHAGPGGCTPDRCPNYHLCPDYLLNQCDHGPQCHKGHTFLRDERNRSLLKQLSRYSEHELKTIMYQSVLQVCHHYNRNACNVGESCTRLHMCEAYISHNSCEDEDCQLDHDFHSDHTKHLLAVYKLSTLYDRADYNTLRKCILVKKDSVSSGRGNSALDYHPRDGTAILQERLGDRGRGRGRGGGPRGRGGRGPRGGGYRGRGGRGRSSSMPRYTRQGDGEEEEEAQNSDTHQGRLRSDSNASSNHSEAADQHKTPENPDSDILNETWAGPRTRYSSGISSGGTSHSARISYSEEFDRLSVNDSDVRRTRELVTPHRPSPVTSGRPSHGRDPALSVRPSPAPELLRPKLTIEDIKRRIAEKSDGSGLNPTHTTAGQRSRDNLIAESRSIEVGHGSESRSELERERSRVIDQRSHALPSSRSTEEVQSQRSRLSAVEMLERIQRSQDLQRSTREMLDRSQKSHDLHVPRSRTEPVISERSRVLVQAASSHRTGREEVLSAAANDKDYTWYIQVYGDWCEIEDLQGDSLEAAYKTPQVDSHTIKLRLPTLDNPLKFAVNFASMSATVYDGSYSVVKVKREAAATRWTWYYGNGRDCTELPKGFVTALEKYYLLYTVSHSVSDSLKTLPISSKLYHVNFELMTFTEDGHRALTEGDNRTLTEGDNRALTIKRRPVP